MKYRYQIHYIDIDGLPVVEDFTRPDRQGCVLTGARDRYSVIAGNYALRGTAVIMYRIDASDNYNVVFNCRIDRAHRGVKSNGL